MDNLRKYVIKTLAWMAVLVLVLGLPMSAGAACAHENTYYYLVQSATCCQDGIYDLRCKDCSAKLQKNAAVVGATGDHPGTDVEVKNPRCLTDGEARFYCTLSGKLVKTEVIDQLGHKMESIGKDEPTCTEKGTIYLQCIRCRATSEAVIPENGHHFTASTAMAETCTTDGKYERQCGECGYVEVEIVPATGHTLKSVAKVPSDCEREGLETLECQNPGCKHSETRIVPKKEHDLKTVSVTDPTCEAGGQVTWQCTACGFETQTLGKPALGHSMTGGAVKKNPTCEEDGYYRVHCSRCDYYEEEIYPAEGHFTAAEYVPSTCEKEGYRREACGKCDYETYEVVPKKDHDLKTYGVLPADCERGESITWRCTVCGFETQTVGKPALGHSMTGGAEDVPATCGKDGYYRVHCSRCDYYEEEVYPAKPHHFRSTGEKKDPTCDEAGYAVIACTHCGYSFKATLPALGHEMGTAVSVCSTCVKQGYFKQECTRCDYKDYILYTLVPHTWMESIASSSESRFVYHFKECSVCGASNVIRYRK